MSAASMFWMSLIARLPCVVCVRFVPTGLPVELHHLGSGSSIRYDFAIVPLCGSRTDGGHHRSGSVLGWHANPEGQERFLKTYRVPWEKEEGLLVWRDEDLAKLLRRNYPDLRLPETRLRHG